MGVIYSNIAFFYQEPSLMHKFLVHHEFYQMRKQTQQVSEHFLAGAMYNLLQYSILKVLNILAVNHCHLTHRNENCMGMANCEHLWQDFSRQRENQQEGVIKCPCLSQFQNKTWHKPYWNAWKSSNKWTPLGFRLEGLSTEMGWHSVVCIICSIRLIIILLSLNNANDDIYPKCL